MSITTPSSPFDDEKRTLTKVNHELQTIMDILRHQQTTPFSDAIVLLNMMSCARSIADVISAKMEGIKNHPKVMGNTDNIKQLDATIEKVGEVLEQMNKSQVQHQALCDAMLELAETLVGSPLFLRKKEETKAKEDNHTIITLH